MRLIIALMAMSLPALAQSTSYGDFKIFENRIIYQHVFDCTSMTVEQLDSVLRATPNVSDVAVKEGAITATLSDFVVDYKKFKFPQVGTPHIIQTGRFGAKLTAQVRDGRYRITLDDITMKGNIGYKNITEPELMTEYATIKSATLLAQDWCRPNMLGLLNKALNDLFTCKSDPTEWDW
ncbi:MAG: hypothetical protein DIU61_013790 [Bacteroidota bacterium]|jgi:hypothetical protein